MSKMSENNPLLEMMQMAAKGQESGTANMAAFLPSQAIATAAATSAVGIGLYSQWLGAMHGAASGAAKSGPVYFNPFTFEWVEVAAPDTQNAKPEKTSEAPPAQEKPAKPKRDKPLKRADYDKLVEASKTIEPTAQEADKPSAPTKMAVVSEASAQQFTKPESLPKPENPDDLKLISGVGPKLEKVLNGLGIWSFAQIADWTPAHVGWVDDFLQFSGRIDRDEWIKQANRLKEQGS